MTAPFPFPVVAVSRGDVQVHRTAESLGLLPEHAAKRVEVPPMEVFVETGHVWRPHRISAIARTGKRLFGREMVHATFEFEGVRTFVLDELRAAARRAVESDPDDLWNQVMDHEEVLRAIDASTTFERLVAALEEATGSTIARA
jgi:hypothetical protein